MSSPGKGDVDVITTFYNLDTPEFFRHEFLDTKIPVDNKTKSRELT